MDGFRHARAHQQRRIRLHAARAHRTSGEYLLCVFMFPSSQELESLGIPGRFAVWLAGGLFRLTPKSGSRPPTPVGCA